jgi:hypothetical protein
MTFTALVRSARRYFRAADAERARFSEWLDRMAVARLLRRRMRTRR